ncbi:Glucan 4-alpha-glucosidase-like protein [Coniochaeta hoffmannii]|uniref:Glucan 4-alpha-glucosidase-like protein n=1 Tax=Coniochaeta hoffmannii TaxID=91930 RepID=A0AA38RDR8_9PEZI|nr:Glucan 4-alpha-glucosidase-like protein [Coniochaeta hoffmannii]
MSDPSEPQRKPRLSLQIKAISHGPSVRSSRTLAAAIDPKSPTSFNTLSNVYVTAIERSTPEPVTAIKSKPTLRLQTQPAAKPSQLQNPYLGPYLDTPQSAHPASPATALTALVFPSAMTATPPMSAGAVESNKAQPVFSFNTTKDTPSSALMSPNTPRRRKTFPNSLVKLPYTHPRNLHSILRNSPLPPLSTQSPDSPRRRSQRLQEKAARRVAYNSPLEQTITTQTYVKSHVDLLSEDGSPFSPYSAAEDPDNVLDQAMAYTVGETRDGGHTPGPFEEMRRRMAGLQASSPVSPPTGGVQKRGRKKREKKRQWVWTIGADPDDADSGSPLVAPTFDKPAETPKLSVPVKPTVTAGTTVPIIAMPAPRPKSRSGRSTGKAVSMVIPVSSARSSHPVVEVPALVHETLSARTPPSSVEPPTPSVESVMSHNSSTFDSRADVEMSDTSSLLTDADDQAMLDLEMELDTDTPVVTRSSAALLGSKRLGSLDPSVDGDAGQRRDTPIPDHLIQA